VCLLQNINWVTPLRRNVFTLAALINTGSLWLYEGPNAQAPAPLLVARLINRGMNCEIQTPDVKLTQPSSDPAAGLASCQKLDGGAMRPPGVWDGGVSGQQGLAFPALGPHVHTHFERLAVCIRQCQQRMQSSMVTLQSTLCTAHSRVRHMKHRQSQTVMLSVLGVLPALAGCLVCQQDLPR